MALPLVSYINSYFTLSQTYSNLNLCRKTKSIMAIDTVDATVQERMQRYRSRCNGTGADATVQEQMQPYRTDATVQELMQPYRSRCNRTYPATVYCISPRNHLHLLAIFTLTVRRDFRPPIFSSFEPNH